MKRKCASRILSHCILVFAATLLLGLAATAQHGTGIVSGRAVDRAGAVLQGARVELQPQGMSVATNTQGEFTVTDLSLLANTSSTFLTSDSLRSPQK